MKGFALIFAILLILIFTVFGFSVLLVSTGYYSSVRHMRSIHRISADSALLYLVSRHNYESPGIFFSPNFWSGNTMLPFNWGEYKITGQLDSKWSVASSNRFTLVLQNKNYRQSVTAFLQSRRLENFALFSDTAQTLPSSALFAGKVFVRDKLNLSRPDVRFLDSVQADLNPQSFASFARFTSEKYDYPAASSLISWQDVSKNALEQGVFVSNRDPVFWDGAAYALDLSKLRFELQGKSWTVKYAGADIGFSSSLHLAFDSDVKLRQSIPAAENIFKQKEPLSISCAGDIRIETPLVSLESSDRMHPMLLYSADAIYVSPDLPAAAMIDAMLIATGSDTVAEQEAGLIIQGNGVPLSPEEKEQWLIRALESEFLFEPAKRAQLQAALESDERVILFQQAVVLNAALQSEVTPVHLHFRAGSTIYPLIPAFSYIDIQRGSRRWQ